MARSGQAHAWHDPVSRAIPGETRGFLSLYVPLSQQQSHVTGRTSAEDGGQTSGSSQPHPRFRAGSAAPTPRRSVPSAPRALPRQTGARGRRRLHRQGTCVFLRLGLRSSQLKTSHPLVVITAHGSGQLPPLGHSLGRLLYMKLYRGHFITPASEIPRGGKPGKGG